MQTLSHMWKKSGKKGQEWRVKVLLLRKTENTHFSPWVKSAMASHLHGVFFCYSSQNPSGKSGWTCPELGYLLSLYSRVCSWVVLLCFNLQTCSPWVWVKCLGTCLAPLQGPTPSLLSTMQSKLNMPQRSSLPAPCKKPLSMFSCSGCTYWLYTH